MTTRTDSPSKISRLKRVRSRCFLFAIIRSVLGPGRFIVAERVAPGSNNVVANPQPALRTKTFGQGRFDELGDFCAVNVACLDARDDELAASPVTFEDGRSDHWERAPSVTAHL